MLNTSITIAWKIKAEPTPKPLLINCFVAFIVGIHKWSFNSACFLVKWISKIKHPINSAIQREDEAPISPQFNTFINKRSKLRLVIITPIEAIAVNFGSPSVLTVAERIWYNTKIGAEQNTTIKYLSTWDNSSGVAPRKIQNAFLKIKDIIDKTIPTINPILNTYLKFAFAFSISDAPKNFPINTLAPLPKVIPKSAYIKNTGVAIFAIASPSLPIKFPTNVASINVDIVIPNEEQIPQNKKVLYALLAYFVSIFLLHC